ncbi:unnamed protein product, partial [Ectocarpus sp. 12 AP-2014]
NKRVESLSFPGDYCVDFSLPSRSLGGHLCFSLYGYVSFLFGFSVSFQCAFPVSSPSLLAPCISGRGHAELIIPGGVVGAHTAVSISASVLRTSNSRNPTTLLLLPVPATPCSAAYPPSCVWRVASQHCSFSMKHKSRRPSHGTSHTLHDPRPLVHPRPPPNKTCLPNTTT